ncbi:GreA/GreB family elongation factor [Methylotenera sp. L2L1]|uniref:GreA/GreB family elongation factor n=1 Tax=Methylotenera sp. L2L1 TaxID=1502770 RepID=UPI000A49B864
MSLANRDGVLILYGMDITMELENLIISDKDFVRLSKLDNHGLLGYELSRAVVMPEDQVPPNVVRMNTRVVYLDESNGVSREVELVFPEDVDLDIGKISVLSPVGSALLGLEEGQTIDWSFPNDPSRRLRVMSVAKSNT